MDRTRYTLVPRTPSTGDYCRLRKIAGLAPRSAAAADRGLAGTLFAATIEHDREIVGMGRVIGDGGCFYQIVDMAVDPAHQGQGLGKAIMAALMAFVHETVPPTAYVSLIADGDAKYLYEKFGFVPVMPESIGMAFSVGETR